MRSIFICKEKKNCNDKLECNNNNNNIVILIFFLNIFKKIFSQFELHLGIIIEIENYFIVFVL